jgi:hypothetical protein
MVTRQSGSLIGEASTSSSIERLSAVARSARTSIDLLHRVRRPIDAHTPEVLEAHLDPAIGPIQRRVEVQARAGDGREVGEVAGAPPQHREPLLRRFQRSGQVLALGPVELQREGELVLSLPAVLCQQRRAGGEVLQRRSVGRRSLGTLSSDEVDLGDPLALLPRGDELGPTVELARDLEDLLLEILWCGPREEQAADPEVHRRPVACGDERVGSLLHAIVWEPIRGFGL